MTPYKSALVWFRRDLRLEDHAALYHALAHSERVVCLFVFDTEILDALEDRADRRVEFIWESVRSLKETLRAHGSDLIVRDGRARELVVQEALQQTVGAVFSNRDYEPAATDRDHAVRLALQGHQIDFHQFKDQVIYEHDEILTQQGKPYSVFTPYKNAVLKKLAMADLGAYPVESYLHHLGKIREPDLISLENMGFERTNLSQMALPTGTEGAKLLFENFLTRIQHYQEARNYPAIKGPSYLSVHLRFGTISIRTLAKAAWSRKDAGSQTWLNELIWRDFYFQILSHRPDLAKGNTFKQEFNDLDFPNDVSFFKAWCEGKTGYPLVDAAMRQLNQTGYMHNRLRMVVASFLVKDLLIDWRWGQRYFEKNLIDFDFSANNGGWQWAASTGCDAQPWFRIFNPVTQSEKFDPEGTFIRKYIPELAWCDAKEIHAPWEIPKLRQEMMGFKPGIDYPLPLVDHALQRTKALSLYKNVVK
jgi:deoxyribodipyrimidine photo-lyase